MELILLSAAVVLQIIIVILHMAAKLHIHELEEQVDILKNRLIHTNDSLGRVYQRLRTVERDTTNLQESLGPVVARWAANANQSTEPAPKPVSSVVRKPKARAN